MSEISEHDLVIIAYLKMLATPGAWMISRTRWRSFRTPSFRTTLGIYSHAVDPNKMAAQGHRLKTLLSSEAVR
jgi:hypothetical protein